MLHGSANRLVGNVVPSHSWHTQLRGRAHRLLVVGKATAALLCCSNTFDRVIYGDNAAGIGLAHGVTTSSWRTRHLRVKVSVWREALRDSNINPGGCLKLLHLQSTELVADGCTKPLSGQAFFRFLEDFGIKRNYASTDG